MFFAIEGLDGSGKSTVARIVADELREQNKLDVFLTSEPQYGLDCGWAIRRALEGKDDATGVSLAMMFARNRHAHNQDIINPYIAHNPQGVVICDRYILSSLAYQAVDGVTMAAIMELNKHAIMPDMTIYLGASPKTCSERIARRSGQPSIYDSTLERHYANYMTGIAFARNHGQPVWIVDADKPLNNVARDVIGLIRNQLGIHA